MPQEKPKKPENLSKAERLAKKQRRARRASTRAAKVTTKSTKQQKKDATVTKGIITAAQADRERKEQARIDEDALLGTVNWQWRKFALGLMNGLENYLAYAQAYDMNDVDRDEKAYQVAAVLSSRLLKNVKFREYWRSLIVEQGFNDDVVDTEMVKLITDPDTPAAVRKGTIRDYNELTGRIVKKSAMTDDKGKSLFDDDVTQFEIKVVRSSP